MARPSRSKPDSVGQPRESLGEGTAVDEAGPSRLDPEEHVLRDRQLGDEGDFLGDDGDPALQRLPRRAEGDRLAAQDQVALVRRDTPRR